MGSNTITYGFPEEEIFNDPTLTDNEKMSEIGQSMHHPLFDEDGEDIREYLRGHVNNNRDVSKREELDVDVLALVLFWSDTDVTPPEEHGGTRYNYWCNILRDHAHSTSKKVTPDFEFDKVVMTPRKKDIELSKKIINYYKIKLSHRALTGDIPLSEYEIKLGSFINSSTGEFHKDELGVIVRLPQTYNVDLVFDNFIDKYDSLPPHEPDWTITLPSSERESLVLNFVRKVNVLGSRENNIRYYFEKDNTLYCMKFGEKNSLLSVLDHVLETENNILKISAALSPTVLYANSNFWYNTIHEGFVLE